MSSHLPSPRSERLVPVTVPLTTQPTAAHAAASALALHSYTQERLTEPPDAANLWVNVVVDWRAEGGGGYL